MASLADRELPEVPELPEEFNQEIIAVYNEGIPNAQHVSQFLTADSSIITDSVEAEKKANLSECKDITIFTSLCIACFGVIAFVIYYFIKYFDMARGGAVFVGEMVAIIIGSIVIMCAIVGIINKCFTHCNRPLPEAFPATQVIPISVIEEINDEAKQNINDEAKQNINDEAKQNITLTTQPPPPPPTQPPPPTTVQILPAARIAAAAARNLLGNLPGRGGGLTGGDPSVSSTITTINLDTKNVIATKATIKKSKDKPFTIPPEWFIIKSIMFNKNGKLLEPTQLITNIIKNAKINELLKFVDLEDKSVNTIMGKIFKDWEKMKVILESKEEVEKRNAKQKEKGVIGENP